MLARRKKLLSDGQRRELIKIFHLYSNEELAVMFNLTVNQIKGQKATLGLTTNKP